MKYLSTVLTIILFLLVSGVKAQENKTTIHFNSNDGVSITADYYPVENAKAPFILLFHQAGYSRGEYLETAPKFNALGYHCMAIDQRSGKEVNDVINQTKLEAEKQGLNTKYVDAMPDLLAAIDYVEQNYKPAKLIILGSSYSSTLSLIIAAKYPNKIDAALAFSPGEYFKYEDKKIKEFAADIKIPVFITSAKVEKSMWKGIYEAIDESYATAFLPEGKGIHGSRALWEKQKSHLEYWEAVKTFLKNIE